MVQSQFANAVGLRFRAPETGRMRALKMGENLVALMPDAALLAGDA